MPCSRRSLACLVSVKMARKILRFSDVEDLAKTYFMHGNQEKPVATSCIHENVILTFFWSTN